MALTSTAMLLALQGVGAATSAANSLGAGKYASDVGAANAKLAEQNARDAILRGGEAVHDRHTATRRLVASQRAVAASQGLDPDTGTPGDLGSEARTIGALDEVTLMNNATREAWGFKVEASQHRASAKQARTSGRMGAVSTLLTGGAQAWAGYDGGPLTTSARKKS